MRPRIFPFPLSPPSSQVSQTGVPQIWLLLNPPVRMILSCRIGALQAALPSPPQILPLRRQCLCVPAFSNVADNLRLRKYRTQRTDRNCRSLPAMSNSSSSVTPSRLAMISRNFPVLRNIYHSSESHIPCHLLERSPLYPASHVNDHTIFACQFPAAPPIDR